MTPKLLLIAFLLVLLNIACTDHYQAKYSGDWYKVEQYISNNWDNYISTNAMVPHPFTMSLHEGQFYYWDVYFHHKGLIRHQRWDLMLNNLNNFIFEIDSLGFIPNATESWGLNRSQIPFFSMMVRDFYEAWPAKDTVWLRKAYHACLTEYQFWMNKRMSPIPGLNRFFHHATPEEVSMVYDNVGPVNRLKNDSSISTLEEKINFGENFIAECEGGMDFTTRFQQKITNYIPVDLNSNLYQYEKNFIWFEDELCLPASNHWDSVAKVRYSLINKFCWDSARGIFTDYDFVNQRHNPLVSFAMFYPLVYGIANREQAESTLSSLPILEREYGVISVEEFDALQAYQWDHRSIWPPVQWIVHTGLNNYGYKAASNRIAAKYLDLLTKNYIEPEPGRYMSNNREIIRRPGQLWEKYTPDGQLNDLDYPCNSMIGWAGGVYVDFFANLVHPAESQP